MVATNKLRRKVIIGKGFSEDIELIKPTEKKKNANTPITPIPTLNPRSTEDKYKKFINFKF